MNLQEFVDEFNRFDVNEFLDSLEMLDEDDYEETEEE